MSKLFAPLGIALALTLLASSARAEDECRADAEAALTRTPFSTRASRAEFVGKIPSELTVKTPCTTGACTTVYFSDSDKTPVAGAAGAGGQPPKWSGIAKRPGSQCKTPLYALELKALPEAGAPVATPVVPPNTGGAGNPTDQARAAVEAQFEDKAHALAAFKAQRAEGARVAMIGTSQGLEDVAAETVQILGQIVVDRASAEAYRLVKDKLEELLGCDATTIATTPPPPGPTSWPKPTFPATCRVLEPLRMQDIASSRDAILGALVKDAVSYLTNLRKDFTDTQRQAEKIGTIGVVASVVVPLIVRPKLVADNAQARTVVGALESWVARLATDDFEQITDLRQRALAAGVVAYSRCVFDTAPNGGTGLGACNFAAYADQYAGKDETVRIAAQAIAGQLISIATLTTAEGRPDARQRTIRAVHALFSASCMLLGDEKNVQFSCPDLPAKVDAVSPLLVLELLEPVVDAAMEGDTNALVAAFAHDVRLFAAAEYEKSQKKAFLLLGSILEYSTTYAKQDGATAEQQHERRTKILESLTKDMTDRTARDGDDIWSFGGSLRAVGGVRIGSESPALLSPISLPLGIGFDHVTSTRGTGGIHLDFNAIDLGHYIAYDNKAHVKTPDLTDAISPSFTLAVGWGRSIPLVLGITAGYSPTFKLDEAKDARGTFNLGATLGMYVPLIDLN